MLVVLPCDIEPCGAGSSFTETVCKNWYQGSELGNIMNLVRLGLEARGVQTKRSISLPGDSGVFSSLEPMYQRLNKWFQDEAWLTAY
jgi:hypothetical protein